MSPIARPWTRNFVYAALTSLTLLVGCSDPDGPSDLPGWPGFTPDASNVVTPDGGGSVTPVPDAGSTATPDTGTGQQPQIDAGNTQMDGSVTPPSDAGDGAVQTGDASGDGSVSMDGSITSDGGDAASGDGAVGDGAVGDGSVGDGSVGDGSVGDGSVGDGAIGDGSTGDAGPPRADLGKGNGSDVVMMGDSWMYNTSPFVSAAAGGGIAPALQNVSGQRYRNYGKQGAKMLSVGLLLDPPIPDQWDQAVGANRDVKTVIMTGGGNDVILGSSQVQASCTAGTQLCKDELDKIGKALAALWKKMSEAGVQDIIHVTYAKVANGDNLQEALANANNEGLKMLCAAVPPPARCHLFATDPFVRATSDLVSDQIHPTSAANRRVAQGLLDFMTKEGMRR